MQVFKKLNASFAVSLLGGILLCLVASVLLAVQLNDEHKNDFKPEVMTNERFIESARSESLNLSNIEKNFEYIFNSLPSTVKVYPTENYYYFQMYTNNGDLWGNFRLDSIDRDEGILSFAYFRVSANSGRYFAYPQVWHKNFTIKDGVKITKHSRLLYEVTYKEKSISFQLNDLKQILPESVKTHSEEKFVARIFDESGFQFFLLFNEKKKAFAFILDETVALPDSLHPYGKDIFVGRLSEFGFYSEPGMNRKVLFAVATKNVKRNNYYDGPFDQLADNFVDPKKFENMIVTAYPSLRGKVRGRGDFVDETGKRKSSRVLISPYISYTTMEEMWTRINRCRYESRQMHKTYCIIRDERTLTTAKYPASGNDVVKSHAPRSANVGVTTAPGSPLLPLR